MSCIDGRTEDAVAAVDTEEILAVMAWGTGDSKWGTEKNMEFMGTIWELWIYLWGKPKGIIIWEHLIFQKFSHGMKSFGAD
jgi:hypothetical protein